MRAARRGRRAAYWRVGRVQDARVPCQPRREDAAGRRRAVCAYILRSVILTRYGLREWGVITAVCAALAAGSVLAGWWWAAVIVGLVWLAGVAFFRDPMRRLPRDLAPGTMISPADGRVMAVERVEEHPVTGGPALVIRIFLSVLNVHVNRSPAAGRVTAIEHRPGRYHDARSPLCPVENESNLVTIRLDSGEPIGVRQIAGKLARRIVCRLRPGDRVSRGERYGMIKFGSSTELILPRPGDVQVHVRPGDRVHGGRTRLATLVESLSSASCLEK